MSPLKKVWLRL